ncbi:hypothetical protein KJ586_02515 [Patescibacteria group bacterium]|nr:hypothetical protein [Patescibacteria group bacterium]MBU4455359.1 hypothetical protein [Patescibacteria group bacterium]MCG2690681.1 hypothetical protein [Candidatus Parcubacteria bacterium]
MKNNKKNLFDLPEKEQERIMRSAISKANKDQLDLVKRYDRKFGKAEAASGC